MIRMEIVIKSRYGYVSPDIERTLKRELVEAVTDRAENDNAEIVRIQFLGPKKSS